ncbi:rhodanese-like domain-containing protein [Acidipila sp. EB88]|uniref:rhodanese-like domain-containing protein n=1 Tax=Acidipila sp. EB88 TaxID=2305226 RepID=UPI000F5F4FE8|nr:rhodanese-like domain-containing protein [Acidipila sp. EB88]RRA49580.1 cysteine dioxygenase [Acidipila sp. EB88]
MQLSTREAPIQPVGSLPPIDAATSSVLKTPEELAEIVSKFASTDGWLDRVRLRSGARWYERLQITADYDIWVLSWMPGQSTGFHDHGASAGAFVVTAGELEEHCAGRQPVTVRAGAPRSFGADYAHDVRNISPAPALSIHAYSPPLDEMNEYELHGDQLVPRDVLTEQRSNSEWRADTREQTPRTRPSSVAQLLDEARARLHRMSPEESYEAAVKQGATLVDIRPEQQRSLEGSIPGALIVERNVLEWRFDPLSDARLPAAVDHDIQVIVFCSEGYTSSLAAAALQDLGLWRASDVTGGFKAWQAAGLPAT